MYSKNQKLVELYQYAVEKATTCVHIFTCIHPIGRFSFYSHPTLLIKTLLEFLTPHMEKVLFPGEIPNSACAEGWCIYLLNCRIPDLLMEKVSLYQNGEISFIKETSGSVTLTHWPSMQRWHFNEGQIEDRFFTQDIYCGVRRMIMRRAECTRAALLHAACFQKNNKTVLLLGEKGAGKSVFSYYMMLYANAVYVSGDQTLVWQDEYEKVYCWGSIASLKFNLRDRILFPPNAICDHIFDYIAHEKQDFTKRFGDKVGISPLEFLRISQIDYRSVTEKPDAIVFLSTDGNIRECVLLSEKTLKSKLLQHCLVDVETDMMEPAEVKAARLSKQVELISLLAQQSEGYLLPAKFPLEWMRRSLERIL